MVLPRASQRTEIIPERQVDTGVAGSGTFAAQANKFLDYVKLRIENLLRPVINVRMVDNDLNEWPFCDDKGFRKVDHYIKKTYDISVPKTDAGATNTVITFTNGALLYAAYCAPKIAAVATINLLDSAGADFLELTVSAAVTWWYWPGYPADTGTMYPITPLYIPPGWKLEFDSAAQQHYYGYIALELPSGI